MGKLKQLAQEIAENGTKVIFRKFPDGEVIALFPELPGSNKVSECLTYMHVGQHGAAFATLNGSTYCEEGCEKAVALYEELESIGYSLTVVSRFSYQMDQKRIAAIRASRV